MARRRAAASARAAPAVPGGSAETAEPVGPAKFREPGAANDVVLERYKYILQQIHYLNETTYRILALYQTLVTGLVGAGILLMASHDEWSLTQEAARACAIGLMWTATFVAGLAVLLLVIGIVSWLDYRREECELTDVLVHEGWRARPQLGNLVRWYETYIILFIVLSIGFMWFYGLTRLLPAIG